MKYKKLIPNSFKIGRFESIGDYIEIINPTHQESKIVSRAIELNIIAPSITLEQIEAEIEQENPLKAKTVKELKAICKEMGLKGYSKLNEDELIELIEGVE